jgi:hypothetical protein
MIRWVRRTWRRWRRRRAAQRNRDADLREFVYLDETSVYSLIVSRLGPVASEFTDTESASLRSEVQSTISAVGPVKAEVGSTIEQTSGHSAQVVRQAIIQSTFKDLHDHEQHRLKLGATPAAVTGTVYDSPDAVLADMSRLKKAGWLVDPDDLRRGDLIELRVELSTDDIHQFLVTLTSMLEFVNEHPDMVPESDRAGLELGQMAQKVFARMLVGLVPIRGRALQYKVLRLDDRAWLIRGELLDRLPAPMAELAEDLHVVGVTEEELFWKDVRRVVFSGSEYTVMARANKSGLSASWTPAKLVDVLSRFFPELADTLMPSLEAVRVQFNRPGGSDPEAPESKLKVALGNFAARVGAPESAGNEEATQTTRTEGDSAVKPHIAPTESHPGTPTSDASRGKIIPADLEDLSQSALPLPTIAQCEAAVGDVEAVRDLFGALRDEIARRKRIDVDHAAARTIREDVLDAAGLKADATPVVEPATALSTRTANENLIDAEIVAIYW